MAFLFVADANPHPLLTSATTRDISMKITEILDSYMLRNRRENKNVPLMSISYADSNTKLKDVLKNSTNFSNETDNNDDIFKTEARKMVQQCGMQRTGNDKQNRSGDSTSASRDNNNKNNNFYGGYNSQSNPRSANNDSRIRNFNGYNSYNSSPYRNYQNNDYTNSNGGGLGGSSYMPQRNSCDSLSGNMGGSSYSSGYDTQRDSGYGYRSGSGGQSDNTNYYSGSSYDRNYGTRMKRSDGRNSDNDNQCMSQCVFGYMELLDENRVPSETLVIRWLQDHIAHNDLKRIKALREIRRCFARLSTSDIEDGCEFSTDLSKCLNLEIE